MHRVLTSLLALSLGLSTGLCADPIPGTSTPVATLAADLPWAFSVVEESMTQESPPVEKTVWRFKSNEPYERTDRGNTYLRFSLTVHQFQDTADADEQFVAWVQQDSEFFGLSKAWARVYQRDRTIYRLDVPCLFSGDNVDRITSNLTGALPDDAGGFPAIHCWCGRGCADGRYSAQDGFRRTVVAEEPIDASSP